MPLESLGTVLRTLWIRHRKFSNTDPSSCFVPVLPYTSSEGLYFIARWSSRVNLGLSILPSCSPRLHSSHCSLDLSWVYPLGTVKRELIPLAWFIIPLFFPSKIQWRERTLIPFKNHTLSPLRTLSSFLTLPRSDDSVERWRVLFPHWSSEILALLRLRWYQGRPLQGDSSITIETERRNLFQKLTKQIWGDVFPYYDFNKS